MAAPKFQSLDVRPILAGGGDPLSQILDRIELLRPGEGLMITAPFLPAPLIRLLEGQGWTVRSEQRGPAEWRVYFSRKDKEKKS